MKLSSLSKHKKGSLTLGSVPGAVQTLVVIGIFLAVGALVLEGVGDQTVADSNASIVVDDATSSLLAVGDFMGLIGLIIAAAVILGLVFVIGR
jgi:hypothetical protein